MGISRGYFGIGVEGISKPMNAGNLFRTAHAFGASFVFTIGADYSVRKARSDTSVPKTSPGMITRTSLRCSFPRDAR